MTENTSRKQWHKPMLNVLPRASSEEQVLMACKGMGVAGPNRPAGHACTHPTRGVCMAQASS